MNIEDVDLKEAAEVSRILANMADLPIGKQLLLADLAHDGFGGMVVKRHAKKTYVFQREFSRHRSRWADGLPDAMEEIRQYVRTGKLSEPDRIVGF